MDEERERVMEAVYGISPLRIRRFKTYKRGGKTFIRDYKREIKGGLSVLDLQKMENKRLTALFNDYCVLRTRKEVK